jgi:hypothetical protein
MFGRMVVVVGKNEFVEQVCVCSRLAETSRCWPKLCKVVLGPGWGRGLGARYRPLNRSRLLSALVNDYALGRD